MALLSFVNRLIAQDLERNDIHAREAELQGAKVHYYEGQGPGSFPTLVLLHGYGDSSHTWYQMLPPLVRDLGRVLVPDLPGLGFSHLPPHRDHLTHRRVRGAGPGILREDGRPRGRPGRSVAGGRARPAHGGQPRAGRGDLLAGLMAVSPPARR